jgi:hypothetical protein
MEPFDFYQLIGFLYRVPAIQQGISHGQYDDGNWWVKFQIDVKNEFAWQVVQEFGHILNYVSLNERLPVVFYPVSAPPYMNGGPENFLYWIIESKETSFSPDKVKEWLESRLPDPVDSLEEWNSED